MYYQQIKQIMTKFRCLPNFWIYKIKPTTMDYQGLKQSIEKNGYQFFDEGELNLNFIWCRNDYHATNHFTDDLYIAYKESNIEKVLNVKCTTKPGLKGSLYNPTTVEGIKGTAVIQEGQYKGAWKFIDSYDEFSKYPFFQQIKPINYWRDGDKDEEIDETNAQLNKIFGTHWHKMSNVGDKRKIEDFMVNNWSLGCCGAPIVEWDNVIELTRKSVKLWGNTYTGTIISKEKL